MTRPVLIIANPISGGGKGQTRATLLARALDELGVGSETWVTTLERTGRALAGAVTPGTWAAIVAVGGDGSLHDVLAGLPDLDTPIGLLPAGTANVWATEARIPRDPRGVARLVAGGRTVRAVLGDVNGEPFFLFVGAGIDARIVRRVEMGRARRNHRGGMAQWVWPACREFVGRPLADLTVTVNGETHEGLAQVLVTRVRSYAGMMKLPGGIDIADGALHVILFPRRSKARLVATGLRATLGRLRPGRDITQLTTEGPIRIASATGGEPFHRDGDHGGELPVEVKLSGREVQLLVP